MAGGPEGTGRNRQLYITMALIGLVLVALAVGFLGGAVISGRVGTAQTAAGASGASHDGHTHAAGAPCVHELPAADAPVLAGLVCNCREAACNQTPLLACHCATAHAIKDLTKQLIVEGMDGAQVVAELEKRWGSLHPAK